MLLVLVCSGGAHLSFPHSEEYLLAGGVDFLFLVSFGDCPELLARVAIEAGIMLRVATFLLDTCPAKSDVSFRKLNTGGD